MIDMHGTGQPAWRNTPVITWGGGGLGVRGGSGGSVSFL